VKPGYRYLFAVILTLLASWGTHKDDAAGTGGSTGDGSSSAGAGVASAGDIVVPYLAWSWNTESEPDLSRDAVTEIAVIFDGDVDDGSGTAIVVGDGSITIARSASLSHSADLTDGQVLLGTANEGLVRLVFDGAHDAMHRDGSVTIQYPSVNISASYEGNAKRYFSLAFSSPDP